MLKSREYVWCRVHSSFYPRFLPFHNCILHMALAQQCSKPTPAPLRSLTAASFDWLIFYCSNSKCSGYELISIVCVIHIPGWTPWMKTKEVTRYKSKHLLFQAILWAGEIYQQGNWGLVVTWNSTWILCIVSVQWLGRQRGAKAFYHLL